MKKRFTEEQIIGAERGRGRGQGGRTVPQARDLGGTYYNWKAKFDGMTVSDAQRLKELEQENNKLKRLLPESMLDKAELQNFLSRK